MNEALQELLTYGKMASWLENSVEIAGCDPVFNTPFKIGTAAAVALAAQGAAVSQIWEQRSGRRQSVKVDITAAAISLKSVQFLQQNGYEVPLPEPEYPTVDFYPTRDGRWIFLHGAYPSLRNGLLQLLQCSNDRESIANAVLNWKGQDLEDAAAERGLTAALVRSQEEWMAHPQGKALSGLPPVEIIKIGESEPQALPPGLQPLSGVRILDLTHVLAGPTSARTLAEQGADVLRITGPRRPTIPSFAIDTGHGKLSATLDLTKDMDAQKLWSLIRESDIFCQSYRPGTLDRLGFSATSMAKERPGIIYVSTSCYGSAGPWKNRAGWEQLAQSATGMSLIQGEDGIPKLSPVYPNDYTTGYLAAYGALVALCRRSQEGGSYLVRTSLCQTAMWVMKQGRIPTEKLPPAEVAPGIYARLMRESQTPFGTLRYLGPITEFSETMPRLSRMSSPLGSHLPEWPTR